MALRDILAYPDPRLRQKAAPVTDFDADLRSLADDLLETLRAAQGLGITAPHIGVLTRVTVIELSPEDGPRTYVNPEVIWSSPETAKDQEGSLSMAGVLDTLERPAKIRVRYQTLDGETREEEAEGLLSVCLQHEIDQLDGTFWIYRLSALKRDRLVKRYEKLKRLGRHEPAA